MSIVSQRNGRPDQVQATFDYAGLDGPTRSFVAEKTGLIRERVNRSMSDMIEIGGWLAEVKARLGHGHFGKWLEAEFEWSQDTAHNLMRVAAAFKFRTVRNLDIAANGLYALAAPSTPEAAREEAVALSEAGERVSTAKAKEIIAKHKRPEPEPEPEPEEKPESRRAPLPNQSTFLPPDDEDEDDEEPEEDDEEEDDIPGLARPHPDEKFFDSLLDLLLTAFISVDRRGGIAKVARHSGPQASIAAITRLEKLAAYCEGFIKELGKDTDR